MTICSLVVYARSETVPDVKGAIAGLEGAEVHAACAEGKLIVVLDHPDRTQCSKAIMELNDIDGVITTSLVYEHHE